VFFEAGRRAGATLAALAAAFGPGRRAVVCRELSKTHEEIRRGTLGELAEWAAGGLLGEVTLVVAGRDPAPAMDAAAAAAEVVAREAAGTPRKEAIAAVAAESGLPRRDVYNAVVAARRT
jgi:16S rRNA (cytidine1402-2'-O)-methyltransferase